MDERKELKVTLPLEQHLRLHSLKVLAGTPISAAVTEALEAYLAGVELDLGPTDPAGTRSEATT